MICLGDKVKIVGGRLYLGRRIEVGTTGKVVGRKHRAGQHLYLVQLDDDGQVYTMASGEIEVVDED